MANGGWLHVHFFLILLLFLPQCKRPKTERSLRSLPTLIDYHGFQNGIDLHVKKLNEHDCQSILGKPAQRLFKKFRKRPPLIPIQISITNRTNKLVSLKPSDISLPQVPYKKIANRLSNSSVLQMFGALFSSIFVIGFLAVGSCLALGASGILLFATGSLSVTAPAAILGSSAAAALPLFLVIGTPVMSTVRGVQTARANTALTKDVKQFTLHDQAVIAPHKTIDLLLFVERKQYRSTFNIKITDPEKAQKQLLFNVRIQSVDNLLKV